MAHEHGCESAEAPDSPEVMTDRKRRIYYVMKEHNMQEI